MVLYHGTTLEKGKQIINDGFIKANIERNYGGCEDILPNTTNGFVYLTCNLHTAYYYGNINLISIDDYQLKYAYIFKIDVDDKLLLPDYDEISVKNKSRNEKHENKTFKESLNICGCVTVKDNLSIKDSEYIILPGTFNPIENEEDVGLCRELSKLQLYGGDFKGIAEKINNKFIWKTIK